MSNNFYKDVKEIEQMIKDTEIICRKKETEINKEYVAINL